MLNTLHSILEIKSLTLPVHLGQDKKERDKPQEVIFHITVGFQSAPIEEKTDQLQNSVCYFALCKRVQKLVAQNHFCLIENLGSTVLENLKSFLPKKVALKVSVHKVSPPVPYLKGGVSYTCGDLSLLSNL